MDVSLTTKMRTSGNMLRDTLENELGVGGLCQSQRFTTAQVYEVIFVELNPACSVLFLNNESCVEAATISANTALGRALGTAGYISASARCWLHRPVLV